MIAHVERTTSTTLSVALDEWPGIAFITERPDGARRALVCCEDELSGLRWAVRLPWDFESAEVMVRTVVDILINSEPSDGEPLKCTRGRG